MTTPTFDEAVANFLESVRINVLEPANQEWLQRTGTPYTVLETEDTPKYVKVIAQHGGKGNRSVWAFIAKVDNTTKGLGTVLKGDILKPASYKAPAKTARGNVFQPGLLGCCNVTQWTGPNYIK